MFAVTPVNFLDHAFAPIAAGQIEIDIRPAFPAFAEETLEDQMVAHRIDRRDSQAITDRAVRRAAAALHHDVVFPAEINDVPDDQKIAGEPEPLDQAQLLLELPLHGRADGRVTLLRAKERDRAQKRIHVVPIGNRKRREIRSRYFPGKIRGAQRGAPCFRSRPGDRERGRAFRRRSSNAFPRFGLSNFPAASRCVCSRMQVKTSRTCRPFGRAYCTPFVATTGNR